MNLPEVKALVVGKTYEEAASILTNLGFEVRDGSRGLKMNYHPNRFNLYLQKNKGKMLVSQVTRG